MNYEEKIEFLIDSGVITKPITMFSLVDNMYNLSDREEKLIEVVGDLLTGIEHAIYLEYLGEGSTNQMNIDFVKKAREALKLLEIENEWHD